jgi:hypothetical protein
MRNGVVAVLLVIAILTGAGVGYFVGASFGSSTPSLNTNFVTDFYYPISINYSGSWNLAYWGTNGTQNSNITIPGCACPTGYNFEGNLNGSGNYEKTVTTYGVGYVENTFCAKATRLGSQSLTLTLSVVGKTNSTTTSNPSAEVCVTFAV